MSSSSLQPLQSTLDEILNRLAMLETKAGIQVGRTGSTSSSTTTSSTTKEATSTMSTSNVKSTIPPSVEAFNNHMTKSLTPFLNACNSIPKFSTELSMNIESIWKTMYSIIHMSSQCSKPKNHNMNNPSSIQEILMPFLTPIQKAMTLIQSMKLDRKFDYHMKAIMEMLSCINWLIMISPPSPSTFVKDIVGATEFWCNKIRKEYKGKGDSVDESCHIAFCSTMKELILDLSSYVKEYHLSGLMWNPKGITMEEYNNNNSSSSSSSKNNMDDQKDDQKDKKETTTTTTKSTIGSADIMKELASKRTSDGNSAATGLKKVTRDQQTWRKEYKATTPIPSTSATTTTTSTITVKPSQVKASQLKQKTTSMTPVCRFQSLGSKWIVEHQTKTSNPNGVCTIEIQNPKEQVYM